MTEIIRVLRVLEYIGPRQIVEDTLRRGGVPANGEHTVDIRRGTPSESGTLRIASALIGTFGDVVQVIDDPQGPLIP
ncbi:MAG: hypothetical protein ACYDBB_01545 [Armatimonadota bacterium]